MLFPRLFFVFVSFAIVTAKLDWDEIDVADTNVDKHGVLSSQTVFIDGKEVSAGYKDLIRSGAEDPRGSGAVYGQHLDQNGESMPEISVDSKGPRGGRNKSTIDVSHSPDFSSLLQVGDKIFMLTHFEFPNPGSTYLVELSQDNDTGILTVMGFEPIDWSRFGGLWAPCAGSVSPWGSHLGSEEGPPNAKEMLVESMEEWDALKTNGDDTTPRGTESMLRYFGKYPNELTAEYLNNFKPYNYGYPWEVKVKEDGSYTNVKHYSMGRTSIELPYVMPDKKTVYITDDGLNRVLTMFVAEKEEDLTCGRLYAAKATQKDGDGGGIFDIEWIELGESACDDDFAELAGKMSFDDIFEYQDAKNAIKKEDMCPYGFTVVNTDVDWECLKVKEGMEQFASRFETRRYAGMLGATTEWNKWEGITYSPRRRKLYTAMSFIAKGMEGSRSNGVKNDKFDIGGSNHIDLAYNDCGCVYVMDVDDMYWAEKMYPLICGVPITGDENNRCDLDSIANPDNVAMVEEHDGLLIGEDTRRHQNDVVWYYDLKTNDMKRIFSTPYGAETTGPFWYPDINGWSYMMVVVQHPYGESDREKRYDPAATGIEGYIGYIGPIKAEYSL
ncbi:hypothetical protein BSKO_13871 [Bryopsis sp. KO-2023]|nr:hypothetical protein BSKO_13871 [Bryopsis sp. KO-2023]